MAHIYFLRFFAGKKGEMKRRKFLEYDDGYGADVHDAVHDAVHAEDPIEEAEEEWPEWEQEQEQRGQQMMSQQVDKPWSSSAFKPQAGQGAAATGTSIAKSNRPQRSVSEIRMFIFLPSRLINLPRVAERWRRLFPFGLFNAMQSACLDYVRSCPARVWAELAVNWVVIT